MLEIATMRGISRYMVRILSGYGLQWAHCTPSGFALSTPLEQKPSGLLGFRACDKCAFWFRGSILRKTRIE